MSPLFEVRFYHFMNLMVKGNDILILKAFQYAMAFAIIVAYSESHRWYVNRISKTCSDWNLSRLISWEDWDLGRQGQI